MKIVILAFNIGQSNTFVNGPGISLANFVKSMSKAALDVDIKVYTHLQTSSNISGVKIKTSRYMTDLINDIKSCSLVHCWSGLISPFSELIKIANIHDKPVLLGPNLIDTVHLDREKTFLESIDYKKILTVNDRLRYQISDKHCIPISSVEKLVIGPDLDLWSPPLKYDKYILWKGNSKHKVKDIGFAKKVERKLNRYKFLYLGDNKPYSYKEHISVAKKAYLYISTSFSETKGMALMEQWSAGVPSVTHPGIFQHGINYKTGIITNRNVDSYCDAISEIMEDRQLRADLSEGARNFALRSFRPSFIVDEYMRMIKNVS